MPAIRNGTDQRFADFARRGMKFVETDQFYSRRRCEVVRSAVEEGPQLTRADKLAMLMAFCGLWTETDDARLVKQTFCLGFEDDATGRIVFQTVPLQNFHYSPFILESFDEKKMTAIVLYRNETEPENEKRWELSLGGTFLRATDHHFNQFDRRLKLVPVSLIANPRPFCTESCPGCARSVFTKSAAPSIDYLTKHAERVAADFARKFPAEDKSALRFISVSTGCQRTRIEEIEMFVTLAKEYRRAGLAAELLVFSNRIERAEDLQKLRDAGVIGMVAPIECFNDVLRERIWGGRKGEKTFLQHLRTLVKARRIFPITEASFVFGEDGYEDILDGVRILGNMGVSIVGNVLRSYNEAQVATIHPDVWSMGLAYFVKVFEVAVRLNQECAPSATYLRRLAVEYLEKREGRSVPDYEFPYKYRG